MRYAPDPRWISAFIFEMDRRLLPADREAVAETYVLTEAVPWFAMCGAGSVTR